MATYIIEEFFVGNPQNVNYRFDIVLVFLFEGELSTVQVTHNLFEDAVADVCDWDDLLALAF